MADGMIKGYGLKQLVEASRRVTSHLEMDKVLGQIVKTFTEDLGALYSIIWIVKHGEECEDCYNREECLGQDECLYLKAWDGPSEPGGNIDRHIPLGVMKIGMIAQSKAPYISHDLLADPMLCDREWAKQNGIVSFAGFPLVVRDKLIGILAYFSDKKLDPEMGDILSSFAHQSAMAIADAHEHEELRLSEERYKALIDGAIDAVLIFGLDGRILNAGATACKQTGYSSDELLTMNLRELDMASDARFGDFLREVSEGKTVTYETTLRKKSGDPLPVEVRAGHITYGGGRAAQAFVRDVTERRKLDREKSDLISMVTHDLKSPLSIIMGYAEVIKQQHSNGLSAFVREGVDSILKSSEKLLSLVEDYLNLSRLDSGTLQMELAPVDIHSLLNRAMDAVLFKAEEKKLDLKLSCPPGAGKIKADARHLERALTNLLVNAVSYTPRGGSVTVSCEVDREKGVVMLSVADSGVGITGQDLPRVFDKYYRSGKNKKVGTGLGLAIVRSVAEAHGGKVEVESEVGVGSTFAMVIPINE